MKQPKPKRPVGIQRIPVCISVNDAQRAAIKAGAAKAGMSMSQWLLAGRKLDGLR